MRQRTQFAAALALMLLGGGGALLVSGRAWQRIVVARPRPFSDEVVSVSGRTLEPAVAALGVVVLAGVVAVLATRGVARRLVGVLLAAVGVATAWRAVAGLQAVSAARARSLVTDARTGSGLDPTVTPQVAVHAVWPVLALVCGLMMVVSGLLVAARGHRWMALSGRYEAPETRAAAARQRSDATLWTALDRGQDPTNDG